MAEPLAVEGIRWQPPAALSPVVRRDPCRGQCRKEIGLVACLVQPVLAVSFASGDDQVFQEDTFRLVRVRGQQLPQLVPGLSLLRTGISQDVINHIDHLAAQVSPRGDDAVPLAIPGPALAGTSCRSNSPARCLQAATGTLRNPLYAM